MLEAVRMGTANPAKVIGVDNCKGKLIPGHDADIILFDEAVRVSRVIVGGKTVHGDN